MKVLVAIQGCHRLEELKRAQRETWLRDCPDYRIFVGRYEVLGSSRIAPAPPEPKEDEIWLFESDWKQDLSKKVVRIIDWIYREGYDFVFKCDVDTYCNVKRLLASEFAEHDYMGFAIQRSWRGRLVEYAQGGAGFWLSRRAMEAFLSSKQSSIPFSDPEDIRTGWLLAEQGVKLVHDNRFEPYLGTRRSPANDPAVITTHKCRPEEMRAIHKSFVTESEPDEARARSLVARG